MSPDVESILFSSADSSVRFALACLEPVNVHLRAKSSFVDPQGEIMHWHEFGDLEGPGWAANAIGGALLLYRWGLFSNDAPTCKKALLLVDHVLEDGFIRADGFIYPYYDLAKRRFCLNYTHGDDWLCPGSLAAIGAQMLEFAALLPAGSRRGMLESCALKLAQWLHANTPPLPSGWAPRRITPDGKAFDRSATGGPDAIFDHSADGLFLLDLYARVAAGGNTPFAQRASALADAFTRAGGFWGSINHDTYDDHENVAYSCAFRIFRRAARLLDRPDWLQFAHTQALPPLDAFIMHDDRNGVKTAGLLWMEPSWDTAYLWENAEAAQAYLEAWEDTGEARFWETAMTILRAIAGHHHGALGFLTEGVDWNNHVSARHHVSGALYGDINYTEPLLNNLHFVGPTLDILKRQSSV